LGRIRETVVVSHDEMIPPNVDEHDAELLRRAYALRTQAEGAELYREWATTYDRTMVDGLGYISPGALVDLFARHVAWRDAPIVDLGCGTGLVGGELVGHGFSTLDGLDLSVEMMTEAECWGIYRRFVVADLTTALPIEDGSYRAAVCNGTFTSGHVDATCLTEVLRILEPGGILACAVHHSVWQELGFADTFDRLTRAGAIEAIEIAEAAYYRSSASTDGRLCVFRKATAG
jgi:predicted TPR repeat methyltransferase